MRKAGERYKPYEEKSGNRRAEAPWKFCVLYRTNAKSPHGIILFNYIVPGHMSRYNPVLCLDAQIDIDILFIHGQGISYKTTIIMQ